MAQDIWAWLLSPISGAGHHAIGAAVSWHGRLMVMAWGFAVPGAILLARFFKVTARQDWPRRLDDKAWWHGHRALNYAAVLSTGVAVGLVWNGTGAPDGLRTLHGLMGWTIVLASGVQLVGGHLRGTKGGPTAPRRAQDGTVRDWHGDHYDMTPRRILFERIHKAVGYLALVVASATVLVGLRLADAPRWMWLGLAGWWLLLGAWAALLQSQGRCIDTYQAIWGPDPGLPGASVKPIGWGIRRASPTGDRS